MKQVRVVLASHSACSQLETLFHPKASLLQLNTEEMHWRKDFAVLPSINSPQNWRRLWAWLGFWLDQLLKMDSDYGKHLGDTKFSKTTSNLIKVMRSGRRCYSIPYCTAWHSTDTQDWLRWWMHSGHSMPENWWEQLAWVLPLICPNQHCILLYTALSMFWLKETFLPFSTSVGIHGACLDLDEVLHNYINPLTESHSQVRKIKQKTNRTALWQTGLVLQEGKTRMNSFPVERSFRCLQAPGWGELG